MNKTKIEFLTHTWNPLAMRCTPVSAGCANCWHLAMADRLAANPKVPEELRRAYSGKVTPVLVESRLNAPLKRKKPAVIGVQFMGDLFHENVSFDFIARVFTVAVRAWAMKGHTFQFLTKRPKRALEFLTWWRDECDATTDELLREWLWLLVSIENQETADERIPFLLQTPAAVRGVSMEPMLEAIELWDDWLYPYYAGATRLSINWVICGGESGPGARPMNPDWARSLRDQCQAAGVPFFFKSWGAWFPRSQWEDNPHLILPDDRDCVDGRNLKIIGDDIMHRVGKAAAGRLLDRREWNEMPERKA